MKEDRIQKRILVVENNKKLNKTLVKQLKSDGFIVFSALNGEEGLHLSYKKEPDLILLDLMMPVTDGYDFMDHLRRDEWGKKAKVIILTNFSMANQRAAKLVIEKKPICFLTKSSTELKHLKEYINHAFEE